MCTGISGPKRPVKTKLSIRHLLLVP